MRCQHQCVQVLSLRELHLIKNTFLSSRIWRLSRIQVEVVQPFKFEFTPVKFHDNYLIKSLKTSKVKYTSHEGHLFINTRVESLFFFFFFLQMILIVQLKFLYKNVGVTTLAKICWSIKFIYSVNALLVPTFWSYFYFGPYIFISLFLVPKPINACYFHPFCQSIDKNIWGGWWRN